MEQPTIAAKVMTFVQEQLTGKQSTFIEQLTKGELYQVEETLAGIFRDFYNLFAEGLLQAAAEASMPTLRSAARAQRMGELEKRPMQVQIRTGCYVSVMGLYAKKAPENCQAPRHLLRQHWRLLKGASPGYYSVACLMSVLCPSFEVASQVLDVQGIANNRERLQTLAGHFAKQCHGRQAELSHSPGESLEGKRVILGLDGGRTRTRMPDGKVNRQGNPTFDTPWREPKMFVIDVMDEQGNIERNCLPIYGTVFGDDELIDLLESHLGRLGVEKAKQVQIVADGAPWIWNRMRPMLLKIGVAEAKIVETVDYYHASQYVHKIIEGLPKKFSAQSKKLLQSFKAWLWDGKIEAIVDKCEEIFKRPSDEIVRYVAYLSKNISRMQYADYQAGKLACGSGIIESGIRRVINLRFKNSSAFWYPDNVECLFFLRGVLLSFRWQILMKNFVTL